MTKEKRILHNNTVLEDKRTEKVIFKYGVQFRFVSMKNRDLAASNRLQGWSLEILYQFFSGVITRAVEFVQKKIRLRLFNSLYLQFLYLYITVGNNIPIAC